jgi:hypothetical protein
VGARISTDQKDTATEVAVPRRKLHQHFLMNVRTHALLILLLALVAQGCKSSNQTAYSTPQAAVDALVSAARSDNTDQLKAMFGPDAMEVLSSGDAVADEQARKRFLERYDQKHELVGGQEGPQSMQLLIGSDDWPFAIPIVMHKGAWVFDTEKGYQEIINRRVGRNEHDAVQVCLAIADAQREYAERDPAGKGIPVYAQKIVSDPGQKNGLYWPTKDGEKSSPLGELAAEASAEGYKAKQGQRIPYHGYYYRMLMKQGASADGGAREYLVNGVMIGGFAVIAWPAEYDSSGVMTFIVNQDAQVYEQDFGVNTAKTVSEITTYDPGEGWRKVE